LKGAALVLALVVILVVAAAGIYAASITGFVTFSPQGSSGINAGVAQNNLSGLVIGTPAQNQSGGDQASASSSSGTQPASNGTSATQQNQTANRTTTVTNSGGGSSGGGGGGGAAPCSPSWDCAVWSSCSPQGSQTRTCTDTLCGTSSRTETRNCTYAPPAEPSSGCNGICLMPSTLSISKSQNSTFSMYVYINTTESIYAVQFDLNYDNSKINATNATEGGFLKQDGASTYPVITNYHSNGRIRYGNTRMGTQSGVSGSGVLMDVVFSADAAGAASLSLGNVTIVGPDLQALNIPVSGSSVINIAA